MDELDAEEAEQEQHEAENQQPQEIQREESSHPNFRPAPATNSTPSCTKSNLNSYHSTPVIANVDQPVVKSQSIQEPQPVQAFAEPTTPAPTTPTREQPTLAQPTPPILSPIPSPPPTPATREHEVSKRHVEAQLPPNSTSTNQRTSTTHLCLQYHQQQGRLPLDVQRALGLHLIDSDIEWLQGKGYLATLNNSVAIDPSSWNWLLHEHELVANQRLTAIMRRSSSKRQQSDRRYTYI
jgi:hypothetical protein